MKLWKVVLCGMLCFLLASAVLRPIRSEAVEIETVYLDPAGGSDSADGLSEKTALKTYDAAYEKIKTAGGGTIVFLSTLNITKETQFPATDETVPVVLTSKTGAEGISAGVTFRFGAPTKLENMTVTLTAASSSCTIYGEGKKLTIGENVTSAGTGGYYFSLSGGKHYETHLLKTVKAYDNSEIVAVGAQAPLNTVKISDANLQAVKKGMHDLTTSTQIGRAHV